LFPQLYESYKRGELILLDRAMCRWHLRQDGQITIYEIISDKKGQGQKILQMLKNVKNAKCIVAKCPEHLKANEWYQKNGFKLVRKERSLNVWCLEL